MKINILMQDEHGSQDHEYEGDFIALDWRERGMLLTVKMGVERRDQLVTDHAWYPYNLHWQIHFDKDHLK